MWRYGVLLALLALAACSSGGDYGTASPTGDIALRFTVEGAGMAPTFSNGSVLDVLRYTSPVANGDIVVFQAPTSPNRDFVKRVIAGPGQKVEIIDGVEVRVDRQRLDEPYANGTTQCNQQFGCSFRIPPNPSRLFPVRVPRPSQT